MDWDFLCVCEKKEMLSCSTCKILRFIRYILGIQSISKVHRAAVVLSTRSFSNFSVEALSRFQVKHSDGFRCFSNTLKFSMRAYWAPNKIFMYDSFSPAKHVTLLLWISFAHAYKIEKSSQHQNNSQWLINQRWE